MTKLDDIVILEHNEFDAKRLHALLQVLCGPTVNIRRTKSLGSTLDCVIERMPDLVFTNDVVDRVSDSLVVIKYLRRCKFDGPIVVVTGVLTAKRHAEIISAGGTDALHKDLLDTKTLKTALIQAGFSV